VADVLLILQLAIEAAFILLTLAAVTDWVRHRQSRSIHLGLAFGSLTALIVLAPAVGRVGSLNQALTDVALLVFLLSGYELLMFRASFIALRASTLRGVRVAMVAVGLLAIAAQFSSDPEQRQSPLQAVAVVAILLGWSLCILEPIFRFWLASMHRPAVESARLRALSLGYAALLAEIGVATFAGSAARHPYFVLATDVVTLAIVPLLYVSFSPPSWLRWLWRQPEEDAFRGALHDLLLYSPDRATLAHRTLGWATRLVGGAGAVIVDADGSILAARDLTAGQAQEVGAGATTAPKRGTQSAPRPMTRLAIPLHLQQGEGSMIILSGPFTPLFGEDEMVRLRQYAGSITAGLDRVSLSQRIASLEKAKTEFLNVASHELRGPMTVIKGYLTMLEAGSLGDLSPQSRQVLPLLIAKSDEVNWMVEQMVEAARLEEGRLALKKLPADLVHLTDLAIEGVGEILSKHQLTVDKPTRAIEAEVDPDRFQIVVRNLLSNAAKYSPAGAHIRVRVTGNGEARVAVTDEGIGIAEEDQARLFKRFVRIETKSTERVSGTGLGLWLSREIARMHDGDLTVESTLGRGSTFTLQLPLTR
jgi:signal transduction histidine kinase